MCMIYTYIYVYLCMVNYAIIRKNISMVCPLKPTRSDISRLAKWSANRCASFWTKSFSFILISLCIFIYRYLVIVIILFMLGATRIPPIHDYTRPYRATVAFAIVKHTCASSSKRLVRLARWTRSMLSSLTACMVWKATTNLWRLLLDGSVTRMRVSNVPGERSRKATLMVRQSLLHIT